MKLGIFGGTFNPIHYGHLINAEFIRSEFALDMIMLVPARYPVHKELDGEVSPGDRYRMTRLAVKGAQGYNVSRIEIDRNGPSYTITTVRSLGLLYPGSQLFLIIGEDSLAEMDSWREPDRLKELVSLIVMRRPGANARRAGMPGGRSIFRADNPLIDISSSGIRERIRSGKSVRYMLPDPVLKYAIKKGLYTR
ncbi:MAG: nicotinate (nicotinamide) nucleotide adenylyltransferase [Spirochaetes bacterium]|nr:nicotinate (nicotinamide) nucleotide adenylyltransferase [Spirochaetota bacterium]